MPEGFKRIRLPRAAPGFTFAGLMLRVKLLWLIERKFFREAGISMKAEKRQQKWKRSKIGRQYAVSVLSFVICFVSMFQFFNVHSSPFLQVLDVSAHSAIQYRLPYSVVSDAHSLRPGGFLFRAVHLAANSAFDFPIPQPSFTRKNEFSPERLVASMLVSSGLEVRAPPQCLLF
jgi:hypothetical protein